MILRFRTRTKDGVFQWQSGVYEFQFNDYVTHIFK